MKIKNFQDVYSFRRIYVSSIALNTALELGLFWKLLDKPCGAEEVAQIFNIPSHRCRALLELLTELGLLEKKNDLFKPSTVAQGAILETFSQKTWAFLARVTQDSFPLLNDLTTNITYPNSVWNVIPEKKPPNWLTQIKINSDYAKTFTQGLYELHLSFAENFAQNFNIEGVRRIMDVGGGSGVVSLMLLKRYTYLSAVVIDLANVCRVGREIADSMQIGNRILYQEVDFIEDELPKEFDLILQCDAGVFSEEFFHKLRKSLNDDGRLVIITNIDEDSSWLDHPKSTRSLYRRMNTFLSSLAVPKFKREPNTVEDIKNLLIQSGFQKVSQNIWENGPVIIQAIK
ncbi:MAG: methyltransferase [Candidatus Hodarchaeales archaeon]|jgi:SAM-dependent methyltransferase